jgi:hypothetical protein
MKYFLCVVFLFASAMTLVNAAESENASPWEVKDAYLYCVEAYGDKDEKQLLNCVNEEMIAGEYNTFKTLADVLAYIEKAD